MKVLFDHPNPFLLAHGGFQTQIEQTKAALGAIGVDVEYVRWWDEKQSGDLIHFFGRPSGAYIDFAHQKGIKVLVAELHTGLGSRSAKARNLQKLVMGLAQKLLPGTFTAKLAWDAYQKADACVALTEWEAILMREMFDAPASKVHVVPNGVEEVFFQSKIPDNPNEFLVCTATIAPRKRVVELCQAAIAARTPVWIIGKPYSEEDSYYLRFVELQKAHPSIIRYEGGISDRAKMAEIYRNSRGFVLLSNMESLSLSALEAAASGCPLLLADLPWARYSFGDEASYSSIGSPREEAEALKKFHESAPGLKRPSPPLRWTDVAQKLANIYQTLLR